MELQTHKPSNFRTNPGQVLRPDNQTQGQNPETTQSQNQGPANDQQTTTKPKIKTGIDNDA